MRKRNCLPGLITTLMLIIVGVGLFFVSANAEEQEEDAWKYTVENEQAKVTGYSGSARKLIIPEELGGYPVVYIGYEAFSGVDCFETVVIPDSVLEIGSYAFDACTSLSSIDFGNGVQTIGNFAFRGCDLYSVDIPDNVKTIGQCAFKECSSLWSISIGSGVEEIGPGAFIYTAFYNEELNWKGDILYIDHCLIEAKDTVETCLMPKDTWFVADYAFFRCGSLSYVEFSEALKYIGNHAFSECAELSEVLLPGTVVSIGNNAFSFCAKLKSFDFPTGLETIGTRAFRGCTGLTELEIPKSVSSIGFLAFDECDNLEKVTLPFAGSALDGDPTMDYVFSSSTCFYLKEIVITKATEIGSYAFDDCSQLEKVVLPEALKTIGDYAFSGCKKLTDCKIPAGVTEIGSYAFSGCIGLTTVDFPTGLETIGTRAFRGCTGLTELEIPKSVSSIGFLAFDECKNLNKVVILNPELGIVEAEVFPANATIIYLDETDINKPHLRTDDLNMNLAVLNAVNSKITRIYWGYAGEEKIFTQNWNTFASAVPSSVRVSDYNPTEGEVYAMEKQGYYLFWIQYIDAEGKSQNICQTVYAEGALDENYGKPYLELDESGKVAWMNFNGTTVQKMYWGFIGDTDYKYDTWPEFKTRIGDTYLPDYGVKDGEGYIVNKEGYYRFVIVYLDAQGQRQERYFTVKAETPATAPSIDNSALSISGVLVNDEGYSSKVYYGYIGDADTKYVDFNTFKAMAENFTTVFGPKPGTAFQMDKAGYWRFVINYTVNGATKDAVCTVYVDEADLALGTPKMTQSGGKVSLDANGTTVTKLYIGYMGADPVEIDSWADYTANRKTNGVYYAPKDGTAFTLGTTAGYYTVVVSYNTGGAEQLAFYAFHI